MESIVYRDELKKARQELAELIRAREEIEIKIAKQKRKIAALAELCDESEFADQSLDLDLGDLTEAVKTALRSSRKEWLHVGEVISILQELGFPIRDYKAPTATVSTSLRRLKERDEVVAQKVGPDYEYKWVGPRR